MIPPPAGYSRMSKASRRVVPHAAVFSESVAHHRRREGSRWRRPDGLLRFPGVTMMALLLLVSGSATEAVGGILLRLPESHQGVPTVEATQDTPTVEAAGQVITAVEFEGQQRSTPAYLRDVVAIRPSGRANAEALVQDVGRLLRTGRFEDVRYELRPDEGGVRVVFVLRERPVVRRIIFSGNSKLSDHELKKKVPLKTGESLDRLRAEEGRDAIAAFYKEKGFGDVEVRIDEAVLAEGDLKYIIKEGVRLKVTAIRFEGRQSLTEGELKKQIETRTALWIFRSGTLDPDQVSTDAAKVQGYYRDEGFLDAKVGFRIEPGDKEHTRTVVFDIQEGMRYRVEDVRYEGNTVFSTEELALLGSLKPGDFILQRKLDADRRLFETRYGEIGYIERVVEPLRVFSETPGMVLVTFRITEGGQFRVGRVAIRGNTHTRDKVVLREFRLYPPDDLFNLSEVREAEARLRQTQIFDSVRITPVGQQEGVRDVLIDVTEHERAGDLMLGFGVSSDSGLGGRLAINFKNFDITDTPESLTELFQFQAFRGAGQQLSIELQPGSEVSTYRVDFTEPYLLDRPIRFDTGAYLFERERSGYDETRTGTYMSFGKRIERGVLKGWTGEVALRLENVDVEDVDIFAPRDFHDVKGSNLLTSVKGSLVRDRTDNRFLPTQGDRWRFSVEPYGVLGGDHDFTETRVGYIRHFSVYQDEQERKHVLSLRGETGVLFGDAPMFERFYAGGIGSLRGFRFRGAGPYKGLDDDLNKIPVGGDFMILLGAEYTFPIYTDSLRGVLFTDMGTVESSVGITEWRASIGVGIRLTVDLLGPVPIEFDVAAPIMKGPDDREQTFSFFVGTTFF